MTLCEISIFSKRRETILCARDWERTLRKKRDKTGREWYYKIQMILQKPMRVQGKMKWFDDQILENAQEWQGLTPLAEGHEMKVTSYLLVICHALDRKRESVFEKEGNRMRERNSQLCARNWIRGI